MAGAVAVCNFETAKTLANPGMLAANPGNICWGTDTCLMDGGLSDWLRSVQAASPEVFLRK